MEGRINRTTLVTVASTMPTALLSKGMGAQVAHKGTDILIETVQIRECKGANFARIIRKEVKKAFCKQSHKRKKRHANNSESDSNSDYSS